MYRKSWKNSSLRRSLKGIALPLTFLMLFVSLTLAVTITYYFAVTKVTSKATLLKAAQSKQAMILLDSNIMLTAWSPGSSKIHYFDDYGGEFNIEPTEQKLTLNITDNTTFSQIVFDGFVGKLVYELSASESPDENHFLKGDGRLIVNQSASTLTQIYMNTGKEFQEITLCYRPFASSIQTGSENGKPQNTIRIHIISLASSQKLVLLGNFKLKITSLNVTSTTNIYNFSYPIASLNLKASVNNAQTTVSLPISSVSEGAIVRVEVLTCHVCLQEVMEA